MKSDAKTINQVQGVLSVEHSGKPAEINDGMCLTILVATRLDPVLAAACSSEQGAGSSSTSEDGSPLPVIGNTDFEWYRTEKEGLQTLLQEKLQPRKTVPLLLL